MHLYSSQHYVHLGGLTPDDVKVTQNQASDSLLSVDIGKKVQMSLAMSWDDLAVLSGVLSEAVAGHDLEQMTAEVSA